MSQAERGTQKSEQEEENKAFEKVRIIKTQYNEIENVTFWLQAVPKLPVWGHCVVDLAQGQHHADYLENGNKCNFGFEAELGNFWHLALPIDHIEKPITCPHHVLLSSWEKAIFLPLSVLQTELDVTGREEGFSSITKQWPYPFWNVIHWH